METNPQEKPKSGAKRLSLDQLGRWEALGSGLFISFGMNAIPVCPEWR